MSEAQEETKQSSRGRARNNKRGGAQGEGAAAANEGGERPKTAGRGRGRGGKQGNDDLDKDGGRGGRRPVTARQAANAAEGDPEETKQPAGGRGGNQNNKRQNDRGEKQQDKNSWIYKYHNMDRPKYEKIAFTAETEIPEMPAKKDLLKEPTKADFDRDMAAQDTLIQEKRNKKDQLIKQRRQVREGGMAAQGGNTRKGELTERIHTAKGVRANKRRNQDAMREIVDQIGSIEQEKRELLKGMNPDCLTVEAVNQEIKDSERRLTTTSMSSQAETRLIKDIDILKGSINKVKRYQEIDQQIVGLKKQKNTIWTEIKQIKDEEKVLNDQMEKIRKELEQTNAEKDETRASADKISDQINTVDEELTALYSKKDQKREDYWKARYDFKMQREKIQHIEWMQRQKDRVLQNEQIKAERAEERNLAIKSLPHPYQKELDCCEHLTGYLNSLKMRAGLIIDNEEAARQAQSQMQREAIQQKVDQKLADGKVQVSQSKREREAENMVSIGGPRKQKGKKQKKVVEYEDSFNLDLVIIKKFALLGIQPPVVPDDLDDRLGQIAEKQAWFEENGGTKLQEQIEEMEKFAQEEEQEFEQQEQAPAEEEQPSSRGGRGGRGRGGYRGGRGGASRGRGRGGFGGYQARNEFEGEDDDDVIYSAPSKPTRNKQKKEDLKMDEDNYPAL